MKARLIIYLIIYFIFSSINLVHYPNLFLRTIIFYAIGILIVIFMKRKYIKYAFYFYILFNVLLLYLLIFGNSINGSRAWINILGISFQPSEFMKIVLIILLSIVVNRYEKYKLKCIILTLIPSILTFLEPDTGNVIFYLIILISILFYKEENKKRIFVIMFIICSLFVSFLCLIFINKGFLIDILGDSFIYRIDRITDLFDANTFQLKRSLINIGTSKLIGNSEYLYIPEETTDFAFSYLIHNIGILGIIVFLIFNLKFNFNLISIVKNSYGYFSCIAFSTLVLKFFQESIHELMGIGLFPITGITLPLVSYGGSSVLSFIIILSIIFNKDKDNNLDMDMGKVLD